MSQAFRLDNQTAVVTGACGRLGPIWAQALLAAPGDARAFAAAIDRLLVDRALRERLGTNARAGRGEWFIAEADESDGTLVNYPSTIGIVTPRSASSSLPPWPWLVSTMVGLAV